MDRTNHAVHINMKCHVNNFGVPMYYVICLRVVYIKTKQKKFFRMVEKTVVATQNEQKTMQLGTVTKVIRTITITITIIPVTTSHCFL